MIFWEAYNCFLAFEKELFHDFVVAYGTILFWI